MPKHSLSESDRWLLINALSCYEDCLIKDGATKLAKIVAKFNDKLQEADEVILT